MKVRVNNQIFQFATDQVDTVNEALSLMGHDLSNVELFVESDSEAQYVWLACDGKTGRIKWLKIEPSA